MRRPNLEATRGADHVTSGANSVAAIHIALVMDEIIALLGVVVMGVALLLVPLGLPGNWIMLGVLAVGTAAGRVGWPVLATLVGLVVVAEVLEYLFVERMSGRYGGSRRAFWGALAGGIAGALLGAPIPVVGSLVALGVGTFVGAAVVTLAESRRWREAARVGWGALLGRAAAAAAKTATALAILVVGGAALLL